MLDVIFSTKLDTAEKRKILGDEYGFTMSRAMEGDVSGMSDLSKGILEKGRAEDIKKLMKNLGFSAERAMAVLEVPESEWQKYAELLGKQ